MADDASDPLVGTRIREYEILELLGKGGMGAVYRARHVYLDEERAIKVIHGRLAGDADFVDRFIREARILTRLRHPNLVQLFEFGTLEQDTFFMVLELIRGESVLYRIRNLGRIPLQDSIRIIREAALGLNSAHQKGVIHRDISPDNLFLLKDLAGNEITKVIDFGIAKPLFEASSQHMTVTNLFIGKPEYCSPEQCGTLEEGDIIDARSDIYSLGITFYYMLAGKLPFYSKTPQGYLLKHAQETPKPVSSFFAPGTFPEALDQVILQMLAKRREDRQPSMEHFIQQLNESVPTEMGATLESTSPVRLSDSELIPGQLFARRYFVEGLLGRGGMGSVFKAMDKILEVPVALKILNENLVQDKKTVERFKREVILARRVSHPNVCRIFDIGESGGINYVSMEFIEGKTLAKVLYEKGRLDIGTGLGLLKQVLMALQEAHRVGIVHRDLKPQNIIVDVREKAHIMDFGISISSEVHRLTQTGALIGTPHYMAPEQFEGKDSDHRADIYAMSVIMFQMFTGRLPFDADTPIAIIYAQLKSEPPKPSSLAPEIPSELDAVILKAMQKDVKNRYQNVKELLQDLEPLLQPSTTLGGVSREQVAHKLLAEQSYSKAVKFLNHMLKNDPENTKWKKLLRIATTERLNRDIRRAKIFIHKKNLIQAQLMLERIKRTRTDTTRVTKQVNKLQSRLNDEREKAIKDYLAQANELIEKKAWTEALTNLESAWNLKPNDERIVHLQEKIQTLQAAEYEKTLLIQVQDARQLLEEKKLDEALTLTEEVLKERADFASALTLKEQILEISKRIAEEEKIKQKLNEVFQSFAKEDYDQSAFLLEMLGKEITTEDFRQEIQRIQRFTRALAFASHREDFEALASNTKELLATDPFTWLQPQRGLISKLGDQSEQRAAIRRQYRMAFENAKKAYDDSKWEEAIQYWEEALRIVPNDAMSVEFLSAAQKQIATEQKLIAKLNSELEKCKSYLSEKKFAEASAVLESAENSLSLGRKIPGVEEQIQSLRSKIETESKKEMDRRQEVQRSLADCQELFDQGIYEDALTKIEAILSAEPKNKAAIKLRDEIQKGLKERKIQNQDFQAAFQKGRSAFEKMNWEEAVAAWEDALAITPTHRETKNSLSEARSRLQKEQQIRLEFAACLKDGYAFLSARNFEGAKTTITKAKELVSPQYRLSDLQEQLHELESRITTESQQEAARIKSIQKDLSAIRKALESREYEKALHKLQAVLQREPSNVEVLKLKVDIEQAFSSDRLERAKQLVASQQWEQAIELTEDAARVLPNDNLIRGFLTEVRKLFKVESQTRAKVTSQLKEYEDLIRARKFQEAENLSVKIKESLLPEYRLTDLEQQLQELDQKRSSESEQDVVRRNAISKGLERIRNLFDSKSYQKALDAVNELLTREPGLREAQQMKDSIQSELRKQERLTVEFRAAFERGQEYFTEMRWDEAISIFRKANEIIPDSGVKDWIKAAEDRKSEQQRIRSVITAALSECTAQIQRGNFSEAQQLLLTSQQQIIPGLNLADLQEDIGRMSVQVEQESQKQESRKKSIDRTLADAKRMIDAGSYQEGILRLEGLLEQEPGLQPAMELKERAQSILIELKAGAEVEQQFAAAIRALMEQRYSDCRAVIRELISRAKNNKSQKEIVRFAEEFEAIARSMDSANWAAAQKTLAGLDTRSQTLIPHSRQIEQLQGMIREQAHRETEFTRLLEDGLRQIKTKQWDTALKSFEKLNQSPFTTDQVQHYLGDVRPKAARLQEMRNSLSVSLQEIENHIKKENYDEAIRIAKQALAGDYREFPFQTEITILNDRLARATASRTKHVLDEAAKAMQSQDFTKAEQLYRKVHEWEPSNATAELGLRQIEMILNVPESSITGGTLIRKKRAWWMLAGIPLLLIVMVVAFYLLQPTLTTRPTPPSGPVTVGVTINAVPWARITLSPVSTDVKLPLIRSEDLITPCYLQLPVGEYFLQLDNGKTRLDERISVSPTSNSFVYYVMGDFDAQNVVKKLESK